MKRRPPISALFVDIGGVLLTDGLDRQETNVLVAQEALYHRAKCNWAARRGEYDAAMEATSTSSPQPAEAAA